MTAPSDDPGEVGFRVTGIDSLLLRADDFEAACSEYTTLFGSAPLRLVARAAPNGPSPAGEDPSAVFLLGNCALEIRPCHAGETAGLGALRLAVADVNQCAERLHLRGLAEGSPSAQAWKADSAIIERQALPLRAERTRGLPLELVEPPWTQLSSGLSAEGESAAQRSEILGIDHAVVRSAQPDATKRLFANELGIRVAFDREFPRWGVRLIMCKLGLPGDPEASVVEIAGALGSSSSSAHGSAEQDRFGGITWRVRDADATRERLRAAGLDVSEVRDGRRPGTRVATVRSGTAGVPTLLIQPVAAAASA
jgi:catechol 2,3-dioxygenase-like lactoylglutathione lyase family enzyme